MAGFVSKPTQGKVEFKLRAELGSVQKNKKQQIRVNLVDIIPPGRNAMTMLCLQTFEQDDEGNYAPMRGQQIYVRYTAKDEFIKILEALPDDPTKIKTSTKKVEPDDEDPFS